VAAVPSIGRAQEIEQSFALETRVTEGLYERHHRRVFGFCLYQLRDRDDAADAVQTTFLHALGAVRRGVVPSFEAPWLMAIARNVCRSGWDAGKRRREVEFAHDPHRLAEVAPGREPGDGLLGLDEALAAVPEPQRRAVLLRDWQGLSYQEVAAELDVSMSAAETLIFRGREALATALNGGPLESKRGKRSFGLNSFLSALKPGLFGGSVAAKVAVGTALVGLGVTGGSILAHEPGPSPSVATDSNRPVGAPRAHVSLRTQQQTQTGPARPSSHKLTTRAARPAGVPVPASGRSPGGAASSPVQAPATAAATAEPAATAPSAQAPAAPAAPAQPSSSPAASAVPSTSVTKTTDHLVTNVPPIVPRVVATTADTAQTVVTTVVPTATTAVDAVGAVVNTALPPAPPVTTTVPTVTVPPIPPLHLP
jgi:RNA polymerase sigma factor (sigma-70 family)